MNHTQYYYYCNHSHIHIQPKRHELFDEGCEAFCNGRYRVSWTKTMIGYGREDEHFVLELTANSGIKQYSLGNDYRYIAIAVPSHISSSSSSEMIVTDPDGYNYKIIPDDTLSDQSRILYVSLHTSDLERTKKFYTETLSMTLYNSNDKSILVGYENDNDAKIEFVQLENGVDLVHGEAFGRLAIAIPTVSDIYKTIVESNTTIVTGPIVLPTPGKADVEVLIIADPDGYEYVNCYIVISLSHTRIIE
jgi:catechol 2,3-dioxygenase-like lactoylglutathione lyase family enzyme